ncbi:MAG TPA: tRNA (uridine(34)/cytosine(34)/5-carboxymethylaminomethyluridine(34)-2'-O)-methyltransferase TrmL [Clostridiales bacterium]|nr:tRNA (uridine(34)/cytosine(34)/5-carboxymethylaminomethyluridine(34)-2'-O)-methyltransferase TrmL [Clostridiales bacterium]
MKEAQFHIVLVEPEIPQNTGNIVRTCSATGSVLHLVKPLGFSVDDKHLKRAGLDYWHEVEIYYYDHFQQLREKYPNSPFYFASTKADRRYDQPQYEDGSFLVFGKETKGLPEGLLRDNYDRCIRIPMINDTRSLNLANSVSIILYEAYRQTGFEKFNTHGVLRGI